MESSESLERFETLWFFSNVLSSKSQNLSSVFNGETKETQINLRKHDELCLQAELISIQVKSSTQRTPISEICVQPALSTDTKIYLKTAARSEPIKIQSDSPSRRRKGRRKRCLKDSKRRILREIDLGLTDGNGNDDDENAGFDVNRAYGSWIVVDEDKKCRRSGDIVSENCHHHHHHVMNMMPALNDGLAMKQHLKSWAYAVACSVK